MLRHLPLCLTVFGPFLILFPAARKDIIEGLLESAAIHINQTLFLLRLRITYDGHETKISSKGQQVSPNRF